jgi:choline dehydrogenase-like flavoprotein
MTRRQRDFTRNRSIVRRLQTVVKKRGAIVDRFEPVGAQFRIHYRDRASDQRLVDVVDRVVVAAGTLGNVRVLSSSLQTRSSEHLGEGFMDHVSARVAQFQVSDWNLFRRAFAHRRQAGVRSTPKLVTTPQLVSRESILPAYAHWEFDVRQSALWQLGKAKVNGETTRRLPAEIVQAGGAATNALLRQQRVLPKFAVPYLRVDVEQAPDASRSIRWLPDHNGGRMSVEWDVNDAERASIARVGELAANWILDADCGVSSAEPVESRDFVDTKHMMGGVRMGHDASDSVVSSDCELHDLRGAWVAGASVFPSGGVANPTFTALALADRMVKRIE